MTNKKNQKTLAKSLFKKSLTGSFVDARKVNQILKEIVSQKPPKLLNILKIYKRLLESALSKEQIIIESSQQLFRKQKINAEILKKTGARHIIYKINPNIILGAKITHGDWVWDETLQAKLEQLTTDI